MRMVMKLAAFFLQLEVVHPPLAPGALSMITAITVVAFVRRLLVEFIVDGRMSIYFLFDP